MNGPNIASKRHNQLVNTLDMGMTMLDYAGVQPPSWEGVSFRPLLEETTNDWRDILFEQAENGGKISAQDARWKIYVKTDGFYVVQVYDLSIDPFEEHNLWQGNSSSQEIKDVVAVLSMPLINWWNEE